MTGPAADKDVEAAAGNGAGAGAGAAPTPPADPADPAAPLDAALPRTMSAGGTTVAATWWDLFRAWAPLGYTTFGGPSAHVGQYLLVRGGRGRERGREGERRETHSPFHSILPFSFPYALSSCHDRSSSNACAG
jgi:hypothetical protein